MGQKIELGKVYDVNIGIITKPKTLSERINSLEERIALLTQAFNSTLVEEVREQEDIHVEGTNKDGIPIDISLLSNSMRGGIHILSVKQDGYWVGIDRYDSLSAAAEGVSGVRRSGWVFWKVPNGKTVKEVYGKVNGQKKQKKI